MKQTCKHLLAFVCVTAMLFTCLTGLTFTVGADTQSSAANLPAPYAEAYFDAEGIVSSTGVGLKSITNSNLNKTSSFGAAGAPVNVPGTDLYGYTASTSGLGICFTTKLTKAASNKPIVYAFEYYIDSETELTGNVLTLYDRVHGTRNTGGLRAGRGVVMYTLTAGEVEERRNSDNWLCAQITGEGVGKLYITGFKVLDAAAAGVPEDPNTFFCGAITDYYPNTPVTVCSIADPNSVCSGSHTTHGYTLYARYSTTHLFFLTQGALNSGASATTNQPIYLKMYTHADVEDGTAINISSFEASNGSKRGDSKNMLGLDRNPDFIINNGVGSVYLPKTSFNNGLSGTGAVGSIKFTIENGNKIARLEAYDVQTYCTSEGATAEMKAELHAAMLANEHNITYVEGEPTCSTCGESLVVEAACEHTNTTSSNAADADCKNDGYTGDTICLDCGEVIANGTVIPALNHTPVSAENGKDATCTEEGYTGDTVCDVCGDMIEKGSVIPVKDHTPVSAENAKDATCAEEGYTGDIVCDVCGDMIEKGSAIPVKDHTEKVVNAKDAVINGEAGYTGDIVCDVCGETISEGKEIVLTFVDGVYRVNGKATSYVGLIEYNGNYYYIGSYATAVTGRYLVSTTNDLVAKGYYFFDETGAMVTEDGVYNGFYYENGAVVAYAGMVESDGDVYYVAANGAVKTGRYTPVTLNGYAKGNYYFGADGKMQTNVVVDGFYYGNDGRSIAYVGLVEVDGAYYYVKDSGKVVTNNAKFYVTTTNGLMNKGFYAFGADGAMIID